MQYRSNLVAFAIIAACLSISSTPVFAQQTPSAPPANAPLVLTEKDNDKTVQVTVGQRLVIQLPSTPGTGYQWVLQSDSGPLVGGRQEYTSNGAGMPGAAGTETFKFYGKETGTTTLTLDYRRPWENDPPGPYLHGDSESSFVR